MNGVEKGWAAEVEVAGGGEVGVRWGMAVERERVVGSVRSRWEQRRQSISGLLVERFLGELGRT